MDNHPFSNRELTGMFATIDLKLDTITEQTTKTNGRVSKLEERQDRFENWQNRIIGGMAVLAAIVLPLSLYFIQQWLPK